MHKANRDTDSKRHCGRTRQRVEIRLDLDFPVGALLLLALESLRLGAHDTTTPVTAGLLRLVHEAFLDG